MSICCLYFYPRKDEDSSLFATRITCALRHRAVITVTPSVARAVESAVSIYCSKKRIIPLTRLTNPHAAMGPAIAFTRDKSRMVSIEETIGEKPRLAVRLYISTTIRAHRVTVNPILPERIARRALKLYREYVRGITDRKMPWWSHLPEVTRATWMHTALRQLEQEEGRV